MLETHLSFDFNLHAFPKTSTVSIEVLMFMESPRQKFSPMRLNYLENYYWFKVMLFHPSSPFFYC